MLETLDHTICIGSTPTFLYYNIFRYSVYVDCNVQHLSLNKFFCFTFTSSGTFCFLWGVRSLFGCASNWFAFWIILSWFAAIRLRSSTKFVFPECSIICLADIFLTRKALFDMIRMIEEREKSLTFATKYGWFYFSNNQWKTFPQPSECFPLCPLPPFALLA